MTDSFIFGHLRTSTEISVPHDAKDLQATQVPGYFAQLGQGFSFPNPSRIHQFFCSINAWVMLFAQSLEIQIKFLSHSASGELDSTYSDDNVSEETLSPGICPVRFHYLVATPRPRILLPHLLPTLLLEPLRMALSNNVLLLSDSWNYPFHQKSTIHVVQVVAVVD